MAVEGNCFCRKQSSRTGKLFVKDVHYTNLVSNNFCKFVAPFFLTLMKVTGDDEGSGQEDDQIDQQTIYYTYK